MAVSLGSITSANATLTFSVAGLFTSPQNIYQFAVEDAYDSEVVENGEVVKGVDNYIAAGWLPTMPKFNITLQANSPSNAIFDQWFQTEQQQLTKLIGQGVATIPGTRTQFFILNAYLFSFMHIPPVKKTLQPRKHVLICDDISYSPF